MTVKHVIEKYSPVTGEKLGEFEVCSAEEVQRAVARAREAFPAWRDLGLEGRRVRTRGVSVTYPRDVAPGVRTRGGERDLPLRCRRGRQNEGW